MGENKGAYMVLVGKPEGTTPLGDPGIDVPFIYDHNFHPWK
jgi:hypothetical protein